MLMRNELARQNPDMMQKYPDYVVRITGNDTFGKDKLDYFISVGSKTPVIATTSKLLSTGADCKMTKLIVLDEWINSMTEFKQIIGRGTRIREKDGKTYFIVMDIRGVTALFADPDWDGPIEIDEDYGREKRGPGPCPPGPKPNPDPDPVDPPYPPEEKPIVDENGCRVRIINKTVSVYDTNGKLLRQESIVDYTKTNIIGTYASLDNFIRQWTSEEKKKKIQELLASKGIDLEALKADQHMSDVDDFDFICHVAFDKKPLTRKERANNVKKRDFLSKYSGVAREVLEALLDQYMNVGIYELEHEAILTTPQFAKFGKIQRIFKFFGGEDMFIDGNSPIIMSNRKDKEGLFSGLGTGDKILIFHDGIADTYPGRTGAYWCVKLEDGTQADIPEQVIEELTELGWTIVGNEADPDSVTPEPGAYAFEAQYIRTNGGPEDGYPYHTVISSRAELEAYYEAYKDIYSLERRETVYSDSTIGFLDACDKYDNAYFERQNLVLIVLQEGSGSIRHEITDVRRHRIENGALDGWDITIDRKVPEAGTEDMAQWHLFLEVQMGDVIKATDKVWINGKQSERTPAISGLVGISRTPSISAYQDPWGVKLTAKNITPSGLTIVCTQQDGEPTGELQTGSYYGLEMLQDGEWVAVELLPMEYELAWTSGAWMIPNNAETEWEVNWSRLYGELPAGSYRISKSVMDFRGTGDYDTKTYYAGFDLVDAADTSNVSYEHGGFGVSVPLLSGWEYKVEEYSADGMSYGVSFRPAGEDGWIDFQYWPTFGVCGTGLSMKEFGNGSMGTYDGGAIWNFISYPASKGNFVATTQGVNSWWSRYGETAMEIITQVICTDTIVD